MGFFSRKKKSSSAAPSPASSSTPTMSSLPVSPALSVPMPVYKPQITLRVALDPAPITGLQSTFTVQVDKDASLDDLRYAIAAQTGYNSMSLFKVSIPLLGHSQAIQYRTQFSKSVDLVTSFPAFNMDDSRQVNPSFGGARAVICGEAKKETKVDDWFPEVLSLDMISVLVRTSESSSNTVPLTLVVHFAPTEPTTSTSSRPVKLSYKAPTVVTAPTDYTVRELKRAILEADGRTVVEEHLKRVILWQVEMSEEEMVIIGERGGLKNGRMPWPYPPGAPVPVAMSDDDLPISRYFGARTSNARMISVSIWLDAAASAAMPSVPSTTAPAFKYPMEFELSSAATTPAPARRTRQRPSTAPAVVVDTSRTGSIPAIPAFGAKRISVRGSVTPNMGQNTQHATIPPLSKPIRPRMMSPSSTSDVPTKMGLGINCSSTDFGPSDWVPHTRNPVYSGIPRSTTLAAIPRGSMSSECSSTDENHIPSLSFSQLSLTIDPADKELGPVTPDVSDRSSYEWLTPTLSTLSNINLDMMGKKGLAREEMNGLGYRVRT